MSNSEWKLQVLNEAYQGRIDEEGIVNGDILSTPSLEFHKKMPKGAVLRELQHQPLHLSYWETPYYKKSISEFIKGIDPKHSTIADLGCGDGRFTEMLLDLGFEKIIASDVDLRPLKVFSQYVKEKNLHDKVLIIHSSIEKIPIKKNQLDVALALGVFYYLGEGFFSAIQKVVDSLKPNGLLINSEPDLEGALYKSMFFETLDDVIENYKDRRFKEEKGESLYKFRIFTEKEVEENLSKAGLKVLDRHGLSLLPSILRIMMVRGLFSEEVVKEQESNLREIFDFMDNNGRLYKHVIWKSIRVS